MTAVEIKKANPLNAYLIGRGVGLVGAGKQKTTNRCPTTEHKRGHLCVTVDTEKDVWHCNDCGTGGDVIRWMALEQGKSDAATIKSFKGAVKPPAQCEKSFDWQLCVSTFTEKAKHELADWRGFSPDFVNWLHRKSIVGIHAGSIAFAVHKAGRVIGCHYLANRAAKRWQYHPKGNGTQPLVFGNPGSAVYVLCFESQWDAFAVMDKFSWHTGPPDDYAIFVTRGAENGKLIKGQCSPDAVLYSFVQNDGESAKWAAETWLTAIAAYAGCKVMRVTTPAPHKDANDWMRAGAGKAEIETAIREAKPVAAPEFTPASKPRPDGQDGHHSATPSRWFSEKYPSLLAEFGEAILESTDENGTVSARDIGEDFLAATLGEKGSPEVPTIFLPTEEKFYTYCSADGVFVHQREAALLAQLSRELLQCARDCKQSGCETKTLEFRFRDAANLSGVLRKARGLLAVQHDYFASDLTKFIPCANGMLRLEDKTLLPFSPSYRRRNKLAVPFNPSAKCLLFLDTLMRPALDDEALDYLQRWCGLALIGENVAQRFPILTGTAGGGKGTFIRVLNLLLESDGHAVFAREGLRRDDAQTLTVPDCYAAYVEFCSQHGWTALTRNKFTPEMTDEVVRQFGITSRNDILDSNGKSQRGWKGLALAEKFP